MIKVYIFQCLMMYSLQTEKYLIILQKEFQNNYNMKKIVLKVTVEVPDDYVLDDPFWLMEDLNTSGFDYDVECI